MGQYWPAALLLRGLHEGGERYAGRRWRADHQAALRRTVPAANHRAAQGYLCRAWRGKSDDQSADWLDALAVLVDAENSHLNPVVAWLLSVGRASMDGREVVTPDGVAIAAVLAAADGRHADEVAEAIRLLNEVAG